MTRITEGERSEVAENLRSLTIGRSIQYKEQFFDELAEVVVGFEDYHDFYVVLEKLADLIEPEERTCRNIADETYREFGEPFKCSECGADPHEGENFFCGFSSGEHDWRFCPNCGARVVRDA